MSSELSDLLFRDTVQITAVTKAICQRNNPYFYWLDVGNKYYVHIESDINMLKLK